MEQAKICRVTEDTVQEPLYGNTSPVPSASCPLGKVYEVNIKTLMGIQAPHAHSLMRRCRTHLEREEHSPLRSGSGGGGEALISGKPSGQKKPNEVIGMPKS